MIEKFHFGYRVIQEGMRDIGADHLFLNQMINWQQSMNPNKKYFICLNSNYTKALHFGFFDFDCDCDEKDLKIEKQKKLALINDKMKAFNLDGFIYETYHGYHLVLNDIFTFSRYLVLLSAMNCCKGFVSFTHQRECSSLRLTAKPNRPFDIQFLGRINYTQNSEVHPAILEYFNMRELATRNFKQVIC